MSNELVVMVVAAVAVVVASVSAIFACFSWQVSRKAFLLQAIVHLREQYASAEMLDAIRTLWDLKRVEKDRFCAAYSQLYKSDKARAEPGKMSLEEVRSSLHHKRRIVSQFYSTLAVLRSRTFLPKRLVFDLWSSDDLQILPEIVVPLENEILRQRLEAGDLPVPDRVTTLEKLKELYDDSVKYENGPSRWFARKIGQLKAALRTGRSS